MCDFSKDFKVDCYSIYKQYWIYFLKFEWYVHLISYDISNKLERFQKQPSYLKGEDKPIQERDPTISKMWRQTSTTPKAGPKEEHWHHRQSHFKDDLSQNRVSQVSPRRVQHHWIVCVKNSACLGKEKYRQYEKLWERWSVLHKISPLNTIETLKYIGWAVNR